ncbi:MAG: CoA transferase [Acidimicrobiales bacterium]
MVTGAATAWGASGLAGLTGRADGPALIPGDRTVDAVIALVADAPVADPLALLGERAALAGLTRAGSTSCGGSARLLPTADGWLAVNLARPEDLDAVPAWLALTAAPSDPWTTVTEGVRTRSAEELVERAALLGLAVAAVGEVEPRIDTVARRRIRTGRPLVTAPFVVDLSSLWAGPLCSHLLDLGGARVVKVESTARPDGGRTDDSGFFDLLNHGKASVALDLPSAEGVARLRSLLQAADVVIEGSRPRVLRQWGLDAEALLADAAGPRVWVSITGHGRGDAEGVRVAFGDDGAAAGGLVGRDDAGPCFLADAVADPLTGIAAASAVTTALAEGGSWLLDAALAQVAASVADPQRTSRPVTGPVDPPRARPDPGPARPLGADTATVLAEIP